MTKRVLICGRGGSLDFIDHTLLEQEFEYVILTNEFNSFVKQDNKMSNFLKNKKIIQFLNITESGLDQNFLDNFNIEKIYVTRLKPNSSSNWWRQHRHHRIPESFGRECLHPSEKLEPYMPIAENSTDVVILFSVLDLEPSDVYIIGVDFYENDYYLNHNEQDYLKWKREKDQTVTNKIKASQKKIISMFDKINFTYITCSTFDPNLSNCNVLKVKVEK